MIWLASRLDGPDDIDGGGPKSVHIVQSVRNESRGMDGWVGALDPPLFGKSGPVYHVLLMPRNTKQEPLPLWIKVHRERQLIENPTGPQKWDLTYRVWLARPRSRTNPRVWLWDHFDTVALDQAEVVLDRAHLFALPVEAFTEAVELLESMLRSGNSFSDIEEGEAGRRLAAQVAGWRRRFGDGSLPPDYARRLEMVPGWSW